MRRLSTFAGAFSLDSACAVATDDRIDRVRVVEDLANLVSKSLVAAEAGEVEVEYRLLDTTRSYALNRLAENDEVESARRRHAQHFLELAESRKAVRSAAEIAMACTLRSKIDDFEMRWAGQSQIRRTPR